MMAARPCSAAARPAMRLALALGANAVFGEQRSAAADGLTLKTSSDDSSPATLEELRF